MKYSSFFSLALALLICSVVFLGCSQDNSPSEYIHEGESASIFDSSGMPTFSHAPGIYHDAIVVSLAVSNPDTTIHYTTDCSLPTLDSPVYSEPFPMAYSPRENDSTDNSGVAVFNLRAAAFDKDGNMIGRVASASYLFPKDPSRFSTKVIAMVTSNENLYGSTGIIDNAVKRGREWERPVNFQLFDTTGALEVQQDLGIRTNGTGSRLNIQKNFRMFARKEYTLETGRLTDMLFPGLVSEYTGAQIEEFDTFLVRGGSTNLHDTMITNLIAYELMEDSAVDCANFEPAALFLNGEYYGLMMIIEDYSPYYFESHYGVDEEKVATINFTVVESGPYAGLNWEPDDCSVEEYKEWEEVREFIEENDMSDPENYKLVSYMIDLENFKEYLVYECYLNNWDWPRNNQRVWRYTGASGGCVSAVKGVGGYDPTAEYGFDGRWRFVSKDFDISQGVNAYPEKGYYAPIDTDFFNVMSKDSGGLNRIYEMFKSLMENTTFRREFFLYVCEFMNTRGETSNYLEVINRLALQIAAEMPYHCDEYGDTIRGWEKDMHSMRQFAEQRPGYVFDDINEYSERKNYGYKMCRIQFEITEGGSVLYNNGTFSKALTLYTLKDLVLPFTVLPEPGYELDKVEVVAGQYKDGSLKIIRDNATVKVSFKKSSTPPTKAPKPTTILINEIGHSAIEKVNGHDWIELYNPTDSTLSLGGLILTNGTDFYALPDIKIPAGGFKVIFCSGTDEGGVYVPFTLSGGDLVAIVDKDGYAIDWTRILTKGENTHIGRYPDGGEWVELSRYRVTPNAANVYQNGIYHHYGEPVRNAIVINGILLNPSLYTVAEDGSMTITRNDLVSDPSFTESEIEKINLFLADYGKYTVLNMKDMLALHRKNKSFSIYYVEALNSYMIHF